jgi:hypothetical protein
VSRAKKIRAGKQPKIETNAKKAVNRKKLQLLRENEAVISKAQSSFLEIGLALRAIRVQRLFTSSGYDDFEAYCLRKWHYSLSYAYRLIGAYNCHELLKRELSETGEPLPSNEYQLRVLSGLDASECVSTWKRALTQAAGKPVTGEIVEEVASKLSGKAGRQYRRSKIKTSKTITAASKKLDKIGDIVDGALKKYSKVLSAELIKLLKSIQKLAS